MSIRENTRPVPKLVQPRHVLLSVYDKSDVGTLVQDILDFNPEVMFYSTGGTGKAVRDALDVAKRPGNYRSVEDLTQVPEMEGGLVKTLTHPIHAGLLAEHGNPAHDTYLTDVGGVPIDLLVSNLYPFEKVISAPNVTPEVARGNIDIGGPAMVRSAAKNWHRVAVLTSSDQYSEFLRSMRQDGGISQRKRFELMQAAFIRIARYDAEIASYTKGLDFDRDVAPHLISEEGTSA
jgi:phosphoribosylaminoimidazolecarboxamide formyltransferase/IMP cyclohydrolase